MLIIQVAMDESMASIYQRVTPELPLELLPPELATLARAGVARVGDRIHLALPQVVTKPPYDLDEYSAERWSNKVHLENWFPASDPAFGVGCVGRDAR